VSALESWIADEPALLRALLVAVVVLLAACLVSWRRHAATRRSLAQLRFEQKSGEVRGGHLAESLAPLVDGFPVDVRKPGTATAFLGQPVDYVHFDPDEGVVFVEIKSGGAQLSPRQRRLRELVESGRVRWETFRVD
jgi:predicted Holliday junction resolvase-like endonuclease